ncbi:hypothetical protein H6G06_12530 [Anabaena sphaerica FACHB-251]|uniref:Uncharacterized protein n=1 Tax=Anabaena sphaerica FACHB-251 TaxID=2692883 RepID=A0A926ZZZ3_9NOST|nr:hypothetical protein [Anabaena sphaerica]MBD2294292.1 hypothetical protein [Anabaena sphaerica FACHB-251]
MLEDYFVKLVVLFCWLIFPILWYCYRIDFFLNISIWWKKKDEKDVVLPACIFFILPFAILITYQNFYELITNFHKDDVTSKVLETSFKLIPIAAIGAYFVDKIKKNEEIQLSRDILSHELFQNYLATRNTIFLLKMSKSPGGNVSGNPIKDFQTLWSNRAYDNSRNSIIRMKGNIYGSLSELYQSASLIINKYTGDDSCISYSSAFENQEFVFRLDLLINDIYNNLILLDNKSEIGLLTRREVEQMKVEK